MILEAITSPLNLAKRLTHFCQFSLLKADKKTNKPWLRLTRALLLGLENNDCFGISSRSRKEDTD